MARRGEGGDAAALTFTATQELFVVTGLEANAEPKDQRSEGNSHPRQRQTEQAAEV